MKRYLFLFSVSYFLFFSVVSTASADSSIYVEPIPSKDAPIGKNFTTVGDSIYYSASSSSNQDLFRTDGTANNTVEVDRVFINNLAAATSINAPVEFKGELYFHGDYADLRSQADCYYSCRGLFKVNAATNSVELIKEMIFIGKQVKPATGMSGLVAGTKQLYFFAERTHDSGREQSYGGLWRSDGTPSGTYLVHPTNDGPYGDKITVGDTLFFINKSKSPISGGLWTSNGRSSGTVRLDPDAFSSDGAMASLNGTVIYMGYKNGYDYIGKSDGTVGGTQTVYTLQGHIQFPGDRPTFVQSGQYVYFTVRRGSMTTLWRTNGTITQEFGSGYNTEDLTDLNGILYYTEMTSTYGRELYRTGSNGRGSLVKDILPGAKSSEIESLTPVGDTLFFVADDGVHGREVWIVQNGKEAELLKDINPGADASYPWFLGHGLGKLFFITWDGISIWSQKSWVASKNPVAAPPSPPIIIKPYPPSIINPYEGQLVRESRPSISGTAPPDSIVRVTVNDRTLGDVEVRSDGTWAIRPQALPDGQHYISAKTLDTEDNESDETPKRVFRVATPRDDSDGGGYGGGKDDDTGDDKKNPVIGDNDVELVISGRVVLDRNQPISGLRVKFDHLSCYQCCQKWLDTTDANGEFNLRCVFRGNNSSFTFSTWPFDGGPYTSIPAFYKGTLDKSKAGGQQIVSGVELNFFSKNSTAKLKKDLEEAKELLESISNPKVGEADQANASELQKVMDKINSSSTARYLTGKKKRKLKRANKLLSKALKRKGKRFERLKKKLTKVLTTLIEMN